MAGPALAERSPAAWAEHLAGSAGTGAADVPFAQRLAVAWALKDLCHAAWSSAPQRAAKAADAVRALREGGPALAQAQAREIAALTDWTTGIAHVTRGRMAEAAHCFDLAAEAFRGLGQAAHAAQTQVPKIMALSMLGRYDEAAACAGSAQQAFITLGDRRAAGKVSLNLGALNERRGDYAQAARDSRAAAVLFARAGDHEHSVMADINMANALGALGDFDEALRIYARARMRAGTHGHPVLETLADESVALLQLARGRYREALAGLEGARRRYEQMGMPQQLAIAEKQLADAYLDLRLLPEALALFDRVSTHFEALDIPDEQAWTLAQRGRVLTLLAQPVAAAESFERAAALFAAQGNRVGEAAVALARAQLALAGEEPDEAVELALQATQGFAAAGLAGGQCRADVVRAHALWRGGDAGRASALFAATLARARELQLLTVQARCLSGQGLAAQSRGDTVAARGAFTAAVELFEDQRRALPGDELRSAFLSDHLQPYQELLRMALQAHARSPTCTAAAAVLLQLERFRARSLGERLVQADGAEEDASTSLRERLNWLYRRVQRLDEEGDASAALNDELRRTELELLERARRDRIAASAIEGAAAVDDAFDPEALQAALGEGDALVEYGVLDDDLFACVVTRVGVRLCQPVAAWSEVLDALRSARFQIDSLRHGAQPLRRHMASLDTRARLRLQRLHALVWAPLADALAGCTRVLVVPHAQLGRLPFAALHDGTAYLADRHLLAVVPSARLALRGLQRAPAPPQRALVLGESSRLPHAAHEARAVAGLFPRGQVFVGEQATLATLHLHAGNADVIHLACHAQFRSDNPMFSALYLHDGALTVERTEALSLKPGIVVLSACETGVADVGSGNETVGLVRAFLVAGAARVLASQWPVDDAVTASFMAAFYGALSCGLPPAEALSRAQAAVKRQHPHPSYWAAFTLHGGW
jgi:tetratricopeptide (TPR) repeat protein